MKPWPKTSIVRDVAKRRAMHKFAKAALAKCNDGRIGVAMLLAWDAGYENMRRRAQNRKADT